MNRPDTFIHFLKQHKNGPEVPDILNRGIDSSELEAVSDPNNLFSISQHFMRFCGNNDAQKVLEALVFSYHRWLLYSLWTMIPNIERCISANRVIFIEDSDHKDKDDVLWQELNKSLTQLAATVQDLTGTSQFILRQNKSCNHS